MDALPLELKLSIVAASSLGSRAALARASSAWRAAVSDTYRFRLWRSCEHRLLAVRPYAAIYTTDPAGHHPKYSWCNVQVLRGQVLVDYGDERELFRATCRVALSGDYLYEINFGATRVTDLARRRRLPNEIPLGGSSVVDVRGSRALLAREWTRDYRGNVAFYATSCFDVETGRSEEVPPCSAFAPGGYWLVEGDRATLLRPPAPRPAETYSFPGLAVEGLVHLDERALVARAAYSHEIVERGLSLAAQRHCAGVLRHVSVRASQPFACYAGYCVFASYPFVLFLRPDGGPAARLIVRLSNGVPAPVDGLLVSSGTLYATVVVAQGYEVYTLALPPGL